MFYVAPNGNDAWSGTRATPNAKGTDGPFATIARARDAVRQLRAQGKLKRPVTVSIRGGTYFLKEPLVFTPEDSGTAECPVTYAAYRGEKPVISGGRRITGWKQTVVHGKPAWQADLPEVRRGEWYFRQLFVNGKRRPRPRVPKTGWHEFAEVPGMTENTPWNQGQDRAIFSPGDMKAWSNPNDVEVVALHFWVDSHLPVASIDEGSRLVTFSKRSVFRLSQEYMGKPARYYADNVFEALDSAGEWYLDRAKGVLYYIPAEGETPENAVVIAPRLPFLVRFEARNGRGVEHVHLRGLSFGHTEWSLPPDSAGAAQAAVNVPGAVYWEGAKHCSIRECVVAHVAGYAVELASGCEGNEIVGCLLTDMGAGGVKVGHDTSHTTISDCEIAHGGRIFHSAVGVWIGNSGDNKVVHNHIHDLHYSGVSVGWSWGYGPSKAQRNIIEYNHIHDLGHRMLSDMGGIYTLGVSPGTRLANNVIHDVVSYSYGGWGVYLDEGSTHIVVENNVVYDTKTGNFHQHYGRENVLRNNVFAFAQDPQIVRSRAEEHLSFTLEGNIIVWKEGNLLGSNWQGNQYKLDRNLYWKVGGGTFDFAGHSLEEWRKMGQDVNSVIADPLFVNAEKRDFRLKPESPALKLGFRPIDTSQVGPRGTVRRAKVVSF